MNFPLTQRLKKTSLRQPKEICSFSIDTSNRVFVDDRSLSYYYLPDSTCDANVDLSQGFKEFVKKDESEDQHLDTLLTALMVNEQTSGEKTKADIITWRGIMTKLLCLPFNNNDDIDLNIQYFDEQFFIEEDHMLKRLKDRVMSERDQTMAFWGYKFEAIATLSKPWSQVTRQEIDNRRTRVVNNIQQYCSVVRTGVASTKIVLGGEVDCVWDYKPSLADSSGPFSGIKNPAFDPLTHYTELKTTQIIGNENDARKFERKIFKTWAQSFLLGVKRVIYGFRDENGILRAIEEYQTESLPSIVKKSQFTQAHLKWNGMEAIEFYAAIVEWIKNTVQKEENTVWRLEYRAKSEGVVLRKLAGEEEARAIGFILPEFVHWRKSLR